MKPCDNGDPIAIGRSTGGGVEAFRLLDLPLDLGASCVGFLCNVTTCQLLSTSKRFHEVASLALSRCRGPVILPHCRSLSGHELFYSVVASCPRSERFVQPSMSGSGHTEVMFFQDTQINLYEVTLEALLQSPCPSHLVSLTLSANKGMKSLMDAISCPVKQFPRLRRFSLEVPDVRSRDFLAGNARGGLSPQLLRDFARSWAPLNLEHFVFRTAFHYTPLVPGLTSAFGALSFLKELKFNLCQPVERIPDPEGIRAALVMLASVLPLATRDVSVRIGNEEPDVWRSIFNEMNEVMLHRFPRCVMKQNLTRYGGLVTFCNY